MEIAYKNVPAKDSPSSTGMDFNVAIFRHAFHFRYVVDESTTTVTVLGCP